MTETRDSFWKSMVGALSEMFRKNAPEPKDELNIELVLPKE